MQGFFFLILDLSFYSMKINNCIFILKISTIIVPYIVWGATYMKITELLKFQLNVSLGYRHCFHNKSPGRPNFNVVEKEVRTTD